MKRKLQTLLVALALLVPSAGVLATAPAAAVDVFPVCQNGAQNTDVCKSVSGQDPKKNPVIGAIKVAITIVAIIIGVLSVIVIIIAGFNMITSTGDPQKVAGARSAIIYALVGIGVAVFAETIVAFVLNKL